MKRIISLLLVLLMLFALTACGSDDDKDKDDDKKEKTSVSEKADTEDKAESAAEEESKAEEISEVSTVSVNEANVGDVLDKPEIIANDVLADASEFYFEGTMAGDTEDQVNTVVFGFYGTDTDSSVYYSDGLDEMVFEWKDADFNNVTCYYRGVMNDAFEKKSGEQFAESRDATMTLAALFMDPTNYLQSAQYKKCADSKNVLSQRDVYVYEIIQDGKSAGTLEVDKETGFMMHLSDENGDMVMSVTKIITDGAKGQFPAYK